MPPVTPPNPTASITAAQLCGEKSPRREIIRNGSDPENVAPCEFLRKTPKCRAA
jgi:hypothetical protein